MKTLLTILLFLNLYTFAQTDPASAFSKLTVDEALKKAKEDNKKLFVFVNASWVGVGKAMRNNTLVDPDVVTSIKKSYISIEIDADNDEAFIKKHNIRSLPMILIFDKEYKELDRMIGAVNKNQVLEKISKP